METITEYTRNELMELGQRIKDEKEYMARKFEYERDPLNVHQTLNFYRKELEDCEK